jgi:hypothetical protein
VDHRRSDATDLGVPMAPGEGPQGPEDALDPNTRGDYTGRLGEGESYGMPLRGMLPLCRERAPPSYSRGS